MKTSDRDWIALELQKLKFRYQPSEHLIDNDTFKKDNLLVEYDRYTDDGVCYVHKDIYDNIVFEGTTKETIKYLKEIT
jgi:hypothetical protein